MKISVGLKFVHTSCKRIAVVTGVTDTEISFKYRQSLGSSGLFRRGFFPTQTLSKENFVRWFVPLPTEART